MRNCETERKRIKKKKEMIGKKRKIEKLVHFAIIGSRTRMNLHVFTFLHQVAQQSPCAANPTNNSSAAVPI